MVRTLLVALALVGCVAGDVSHLGYKYSKPTVVSAKVQLPIILPTPKVQTEIKLSPAPLPVSPLPEVVTPAEVEIKPAQITLPSLPASEYAPLSEAKVISPSVSPVVVSEVLSDVKQKEGYKYPAPKPVQPVPVAEEQAAPIEPEPAHELANDGYRYKTVRRIKYRYRA